MSVNYLKQMIKDPLALFIVLGFFVFIVYDALEDDDMPSINLSNDARDKLVAEYEAITGLQASAKAIAELEKNYISDELLFREAINAGMHIIDPASRASLVEKMRFRISALVPEPSDAELLDYYAKNIQQYYTETSLSFEHIFFASLAENTQNLGAKLQLGERVNGDKFVHGNKFNDISEGMIRGIFGQRFLSALSLIQELDWQGPISSNHGFHYVRIEKKVPPRPIPFSVARNIIANDLVQMSIDQAVESKVAVLRSQYEITVDP